MQVFGDIERTEDAGPISCEIAQRLDEWASMSPGLERHQSLVAAFIRASELVQGAADAEFARNGCDDTSALQDAGDTLLLSLAQAIAISWDNGFGSVSPLPEICWRRLEFLSKAGPIATRQAEGYAFYALYPEAYVAAARRSGLGPDTIVIGIRSIGTGLAALVAAAIGAAPAQTVRPIGHPFERDLALGKGLAGRLLGSDRDFAIVDEGPGLSGSSFNCVADWLQCHGVSASRIHFFPSHGGDLGSAAQPGHRQRWAVANRHVVSFEQLLLDASDPAHRLQTWLADMIGPLREPLRDLSGGAWRDMLKGAADLPADPAMEKRKFLAVSDKGRWLAKFVGLGRSGEAKLSLAQTLSEAGLAPEPAGLCHGFLVMPFIDGKTGSDNKVPDKRLLDYLTLRASLPADRPGAQLDALFAMAAYNIGQCCGEPAAALVRAGLGDPGRFTPIPCCTDNRMHAWEWIKSAQGWLKLDALDHHAAHDLVGCQDIAWDVAGAAVEFGLTAAERDALCEALGQRMGRALPQDFVAACEICYLGFQIGLWTMAKDRNNDAERRHIDTLLRHYAGHRAITSLGITCVTL